MTLHFCGTYNLSKVGHHIIQLSNLPHQIRCTSTCKKYYIILGKHLVYKAIIYMKQGL